MRGALWMALSSVSFAAMSALVRPASAEIHPFEVTFFRVLIGTVAMLPLTRGRPLFPERKRWAYVLRGVVDGSGMLLWFLAITLMPLAEATALNFTAPLFGTLLAIVVLGEVVRVRRWLAIAIGLVGAMVILRPGARELDLPSLLVLGAALASAISRVTVRYLSRTEDADAIVRYHFMLVAPLALVPALFFWRWPNAETMLWILAVAGFGTLGHICVARSYALSETSEVAALDFVQLVAAAALGYVFFAESPDRWTWIGAGLISGAAIYIARREARLRRERAVAQPRPAGVGPPT